MKKTVLTFVAVAFGMGVAFAQTAPQVEKQDKAKTELTIDRMSEKPSAEAGRKAIKVEELPAVVQTNLKGEAFKNLKVVSVTEVKPEAAVVQYEIAFVDNAAAATEPTLIVLFDDKGKEASRKEASAKQEK